jgi:DNA-directed RNA polymerase specialized sigma24 family protein
VKAKLSRLERLRRRETPVMWCDKSQGLRMYRSDKLDELASPDAPFRDDRLRELVDALPSNQRTAIERTFFGVATINEVAEELNVSGKTARNLRAQALQNLHDMLQADPSRQLPAAAV